MWQTLGAHHLMHPIHPIGIGHSHHKKILDVSRLGGLGNGSLACTNLTEELCKNKLVILKIEFLRMIATYLFSVFLPPVNS